MKDKSHAIASFAVRILIATCLLLGFALFFNSSHSSDTAFELTIESQSGDFKIFNSPSSDKTQIKIFIDDKESAFGDSLVPLTCEIVEGELLDGDTIYDVVELSTEVNEKFVGTYDIDFTVINDNYEVTADALGTYTLVPRPISVLVNDKTSVYGEAEVPFSAELTSGTLVGDDTLESIMSFERAEGRNAGEYVIRGGCTNMNYSATITNGTYHITPRPIVVSVADAASVYGESVGVNAISLVSSTLAYHDTLQSIISVGTPDSVGAGVYPITATANSNYTATFEYTNTDHSIYTIAKFDLTDEMTFNVASGASVVQGTSVVCSTTTSVAKFNYAYILDGEETADKNGVGEYTLTATIDDDNYSGTKSIAYSTYANVAPKMASMVSLLDTYHSASATDSQKINALFDCQAIYANLTDTDTIQIEANANYTQIVNEFISDWNALRESASEDLIVAEKIYDNVIGIVLTAVSAAACLGFVAMKFFIG